jgi:hypothetical protein
MRAVAGLLDRWAEREQRRTQEENQARPQGVPVTLKSLVSCALCAALLIALPWPVALGVIALAVLAGPGRRWFGRVRDARRAEATRA